MSMVSVLPMKGFEISRSKALACCCVVRFFAGDGRGSVGSVQSRGALAAALNTKRREGLDDFRAAISRMQEHDREEASGGSPRESEAEGVEPRPAPLLWSAGEARGGGGSLEEGGARVVHSGGSRTCLGLYEGRTQALLENAEAEFSSICLERLLARDDHPSSVSSIRS